MLNTTHAVCCSRLRRKRGKNSRRSTHPLPRATTEIICIIAGVISVMAHICLVWNRHKMKAIKLLAKCWSKDSVFASGIRVYTYHYEEWLRFNTNWFLQRYKVNGHALWRWFVQPPWDGGRSTYWKGWHDKEVPSIGYDLSQTLKREFTRQLSWV